MQDRGYDGLQALPGIEGKIAGPFFRIHGRGMKNLAGIYVSDAGKVGLIHEKGLDGNPPLLCTTLNDGENTLCQGVRCFLDFGRPGKLDGYRGKTPGIDQQEPAGFKMNHHACVGQDKQIA